MEYNNVKQNKIVINFNKKPILKFDSLLLLSSFAILLYSLSLLITPNYFDVEVLLSFTVNNFVILGLIILFLLLDISLWVKFASINLDRQKTNNIGISLFFLGLVLNTLLLFRLITQFNLIWLIINHNTLFYLGIVLLLIGLLFEITRLDEELVYWLNIHLTIKQRIPVTLFIVFFFLSIDPLPLFLYSMIFVPWIDIIVKFFFLLFKWVIFILVNIVTSIFSQIKNLLDNIVIYINKTLNSFYNFVSKNYLTILKGMSSVFSVLLIISGLFTNNAALSIFQIIFGLFLFLLTWNKKILKLFSKIFNFIYLSILSILIYIEGVVYSIYFSSLHLFNFVTKNWIYFVKIFFTLLGFIFYSFGVLNIVYEFNLGIILIFIGFFLTYFTWFSFFNSIGKTIISYITNQIKVMIRRVKLFFMRSTLFIKKLFHDFFEFIFNEITKLYNYFFINRVKIVRIFFTIIGITLIIASVIVNVDNLVYRIAMFFSGVSIVYLSWLSNINSFIILAILKINLQFYKISNLIKRIFIWIINSFKNLYKSIILFFTRSIIFIRKLLRNLHEFVVDNLSRFYYIIVTNRIKLVRIFFTITGILLILSGIALNINDLIFRIAILFSGLGIVYFSWLSNINKFFEFALRNIEIEVKKVIIFLKNSFIWLINIIKNSYQLIILFFILIFSIIRDFFRYIIQNRINILRVFTTGVGVLFLFYGLVFALLVKDNLISISLITIGIVIIYFSWLKKTNEIIKIFAKNISKFLTELLNMFVTSIQNIFHTIRNFIAKNFFKIIKTISFILAWIFIFLGIINSNQMPFKSLLLIFLGITILIVTFYKEIQIFLVFSIEKIKKMLFLVSQKLKDAIISIKGFLNNVLLKIVQFLKLITFYLINWLVIWISVGFGMLITLYGCILGFSCLYDYSGSWSINLFHFNLLWFLNGVSPFILFILSIGFIFTGLLLLRVLSEHKESLMLNIVLYPQSSNRSLNQ